MRGTAMKIEPEIKKEIVEKKKKKNEKSEDREPGTFFETPREIPCVPFAGSDVCVSLYHCPVFLCSLVPFRLGTRSRALSTYKRALGHGSKHRRLYLRVSLLLSSFIRDIYACICASVQRSTEQTRHR